MSDLLTPRPIPGWLGAVVAVAALDVYCDRRGWPTLSSTTRHLMRTDTPAGRWVFIAGWAALTGWFVPHIIVAHVDAVIEEVAAS